MLKLQKNVWVIIKNIFNDYFVLLPAQNKSNIVQKLLKSFKMFGGDIMSIKSYFLDGQVA